MIQPNGNSPESPAEAPPAPAGPIARKALPRAVVALGLVSLFNDISSEMIHGLLPVFLVSVLGAGTVMVGLIEGLGEAVAAITKLFSGMISDRLGRRKPLVVAGYGLATFSKPLFALAPAAGWVLGARIMDRIGKGIRGAPRDALIADLAPPEQRGAAFGLRQSLDDMGAVAGPLIAMALMWVSGDDFRLVFWLALIPGLAAVGLLIWLVREPAHRPAPPAPAPRPEPPRAEPPRPEPPRAETGWRRLGALGGAFWAIVAAGGVLTLARFGLAFLILRAEDAGLRAALVPVVLILVHLVSSLSSYPMGLLADRLDKRRLLMAGFVVLIAADATLALAPGLWAVLAGIALWGLHLGLSQGLLAALVAQAAPARLRGTAFGVFNLTSGLTLLLASLLAGVIWQAMGPAAMFWSSAAVAALGLGGFMFMPSSPHESREGG